MSKREDPYDYISQVLRSRRWRSMVEDALQSKVRRGEGSECWPWTGRLRAGYGAVDTGYGGVEGAHRLAYAFAHNVSPFPQHVLHSCDNPPCCNPAHLFLGTPKDNSDDKIAKGRHRAAPQRGERNPRARLSAADVGAIRARLATETNIAIAADYGVSHSAISLIRRGKSWAG